MSNDFLPVRAVELPVSFLFNVNALTHDTQFRWYEACEYVYFVFLVILFLMKTVTKKTPFQRIRILAGINDLLVCMFFSAFFFQLQTFCLKYLITRPKLPCTSFKECFRLSNDADFRLILVDGLAFQDLARALSVPFLAVSGRVEAAKAVASCPGNYFVATEPVLNRLQDIDKAHVLRHPSTFFVPQWFGTALLPYGSVHKRPLTSAWLRMMDYGLIQEVLKRNMYPYKQHPMLSARQESQMTLHLALTVYSLSLRLAMPLQLRSSCLVDLFVPFD